MKTKKIPVNGKPEIAFDIVRLEKTIPGDFSGMMIETKNARRPYDVTRECEVFRIIFRDWAYEFCLSEPKGTVLTLDNIDSADYKIEKDSAPPFREAVESQIRLTLPDGRKIHEITYSNGSPRKSLSAQEKLLVEQLEAIRKADAARVEKAADTEAHVKKVVNKAVSKEIVPIAETFKKAILASTPPNERQWWQNLKALYMRLSEPTEGMKWCAVAHIVIMGAIEQSKNSNKRDRRSDYLTPRMLGTLIKKLVVLGADTVKIEKAYADTLRRYVSRAEQNAKKPAKARA